MRQLYDGHGGLEEARLAAVGPHSGCSGLGEGPWGRSQRRDRVDAVR